MTQVAHRPKHHPKSRAERRRADRAKAHRKQRRSWFPIAAVIVFIVAAGIVAVVLSGGGSPSTTTGTHETGKVTVSGNPLPAVSSPDKAVGMRAPVATGISFDGSAVTLPVSGKPTVVALVAHWCTHCQKDVKEVQAWLNQHGTPSDIALLTLSTWVDPAKPNYPPSTWLHNEGWTPQVLVDDANNSVATAYGLAATPTWVFVGADGLVKFRHEGEMTGPQLATALDQLRAAK